MKTRIKLISTAFLILGFNFGLFAQKALSLEEAIDHALVNNPEIINAKLDIQDADHEIDERLSIGLPKVNGTLLSLIHI